MSKIDFFSEDRPTMPCETRSFDDPLHPGKPVTITFTAIGSMDQGRVSDLAKKMIARYIGDEYTEPECDFPAVGGKAVTLSETMTFVAASMVIMQEGAEDQYSFEELVAFGYTRPTAWQNVVFFRHEIAERGEVALGEGGAAGTGTASNSPRSSTRRTRK